MAEATIKVNLDASLAGKSLNQLNKELDEMNKELKDLEIGSKEFNDTSKKIKKTTDSLDEFNKSLKETDDEVKDLSLIEKFAEAPGVLGAVTQSVQGLGVGFKALLANPIGLLLTAIAVAGKAIYDAFADTEEGANALSEAFAFMEGLLIPLKLVLVEVGKALFSLFTDPQKALEDFGNSIQTYFIDLFNTALEGLGLLGSALKKVFEGDFSGALDDAADGLAKLAEVSPAGQIVKGFKKAGEAIGELAEEGEKAATVFTSLTKRQNELNKAVRAAEVLNAQAIADIEELKLVRDDETKSIQERQKANDAIFAIEQQRNARNIKNAEEQVAILQGQLALKKNDKELLQQLADAEVDLADKRGESAGIRAEQLASNLGLLRDEANLLNDLIDKEEERTLIFIESESEKLAIQKKNQQERLKNIEKTLGKESIEYKEAANQVQVIEANLTKAVIDEQIERNDKTLAATQQGINNKFDILESAEDDELKLIQLGYEREEELADAQLTNLEADYIEKQKLAGDNQAELIRLEEQYAADVLAVTDDLNTKKEISDNEYAKTQEEKRKESIEKQKEADAAALESLKTFTTEAADVLAGLISGNFENLAQSVAGLTDALFNEETGLFAKLQEGNITVAEAAMIGAEALAAGLSMASDLVGQNVQAAVEEVNVAYDEKSEALKRSLENDEISQEAFNAKSEELEKERAAKEKKLKIDGFKKQQALDISAAVISTALAAINAYTSTVGIPIAGPILAPIAAAAAVVSVS